MSSRMFVVDEQYTHFHWPMTTWRFSLSTYFKLIFFSKIFHMPGKSKTNVFGEGLVDRIFGLLWGDRSLPVPSDGPRQRGRPAKKGKMRFGKYPKTHPGFTRKGGLTLEGIGFVKCAFFLLGTALTKREYCSWFNFSSGQYFHYKNLPLGEATLDDKRRKTTPRKKRLANWEEREKFLMDTLEENPFADIQDLHESSEKAGFKGSYSTTRRALNSLGIKIRNRPAQHWCGPEGLEVFKQRRVSYAEAHVNDPPEGLYFIDESILRCTHRRKKQLCKKGQQPTPYEQTRYTAQCHVLGVIGYGGFRVLVNVTDHLKQKNEERKRHKGDKKNKDKVNDDDKKWKKGFQSTDYQKVLDSCIIGPIREHNNAINAGRRPEDRIEPVLVQDRAPSHWSKDTLEYLESQGMRIHYDWPRYSPDLNPIENVWGWIVTDLGDQLFELRHNTAENCEKVWCLVWDYFYGLSDERISRQVESFPRRMQEVLNDGGHKLRY